MVSGFPPINRTIYKELGTRLALAREEANLSQVEVAERIGKPQSFVSRMEAGQRRMDIVEVAHLAKLYDKALTDFDVTDGQKTTRTKPGRDGT